MPSPIRSATNFLRNLTAQASPGFQPATEPDRPFGGPVGNPMVQLDRADPADALPPAARERFEAWLDRQSDARAAYLAAADDADELRKGDWLTHTTHLRRLESGEFQSVANGDHPALALARDKAERATERMRKLTERRDEKGQRQQAMLRLVDRAETYLSSVAGANLRDHEVTLPKTATIDAARRKVDEIRAAIDATQAAPRPAREGKAKIREQVEALAERGRPNCYNVIEHGAPVRFAETNDSGIYQNLFAVGPDGQIPVRGTIGVGIPDALALVAWLHKDALIKALEAEVEASADDGAALDDETRAARLADLGEQLLAAERLEVAAADRDGLEYRHDLDPRALLGVDGPAPRNF